MNHHARKLLLVALAALAAWLWQPSAAAALDQERIQGTIITAAEGQVAFKDITGSQRILTTAADCIVTINGREAPIESLQTGMLAMILLNRNGQCMQIDARTLPPASVEF